MNRSKDADYSFKKVKGFYSNQIDGLIRMLLNENVTPYLKGTLQKYILVACFAAMEYFFKNEAGNLVDKHNLDVSNLFNRRNIQKMVEDKGTTKGNIIASTYSFVNIDDVDYIFSNLLGLSSFLDYVVKLNVTDQTRFVLDGHPLAINYEKFRKAYRLRSEIAHGIKDVKISKSMVIHLWDNLLNIIDISVSIFSSLQNPDDNWDIESNYQNGVNWIRTKGSYKLFSDKIFSELLSKGSLELPGDLLVLANELKTSYNVEISEERIPRIASKLAQQGLVDVRGSAIYLTSKGEKRYKGTSNSDRKMWKRDSYGIICTWIPI